MIACLEKSDTPYGMLFRSKWHTGHGLTCHRKESGLFILDFWMLEPKMNEVDYKVSERRPIPGQKA